jgi:hypothetical protein
MSFIRAKKAGLFSICTSTRSLIVAMHTPDDYSLIINLSTTIPSGKFSHCWTPGRHGLARSGKEPFPVRTL